MSLDRIERPAVDHDGIRAHRLAAVRAAMERHDLDAIVAFEYANGRYIAGLRPLWAPNFLVRQAAVISREDYRVICVVHQDDAPHRRRVSRRVRRPRRPARARRPGPATGSASSTREPTSATTPTPGMAPRS